MCVCIYTHMSFSRDSKWGCRLKMTSLSMGCKTQPTNLNYPLDCYET